MINFFFLFFLLFVICSFISYRIVKWLEGRPQIRICPKCGLIGGDLDYCPKCGERDIKIVNPDGSTIQMREGGFWYYWVVWTILLMAIAIVIIMILFFTFSTP
jgi:hypothetical protein